METKFKPFMPIKSITFDTLGQDIDSHPVIIIHNMDGLELFYIKSRTAIDENGQLKKPTEGEILIKKSKNRNALFKNDSYLDCSQLFRISRIRLWWFNSQQQKITIYKNNSTLIWRCLKDIWKNRSI
ncbi:Uncharacterised protein (plasmid) [Mesomycoplasma conjunctivae]|nr:Uncharacterised protein [Mesomycoplasma conjunctivae]